MIYLFEAVYAACFGMLVIFSGLEWKFFIGQSSNNRFVEMLLLSAKHPDPQAGAAFDGPFNAANLWLQD